MATTWTFVLFLSFILTTSRGLSLASEEQRSASVDTGHDTTGDVGNDTSGDTGHGDSGGGHGAASITTLPIVTWKWHHVSVPYLVALWILVSWICKLSEFLHQGSPPHPKTEILRKYIYIF